MKLKRWEEKEVFRGGGGWFGSRKGSMRELEGKKWVNEQNNLLNLFPDEDGEHREGGWGGGGAEKYTSKFPF